MMFLIFLANLYCSEKMSVHKEQCYLFKTMVFEQKICIPVKIKKKIMKAYVNKSLDLRINFAAHVNLKISKILFIALFHVV